MEQSTSSPPLEAGCRALVGGLSLALTTYSLNLRPSSACAAPWVAWLLIGQSSIFSAVTLTLAGHVVASRLSGRSSTSPDCLPSLSARCPLVEDGLLRRQAVRDHMAAVLGRETGRATTSGNVMRVRGPALYPAPAALATDQTMSSSSSRTLGTRARFGWPLRVVVEPSASSLAGPLVARLLVSQSPRFFSHHARPCGPRCGERGSQGVQAIHPVHSPPCDGEGLFDDGGDVVVPPERSVQHRLVHCVGGPALYPAPAALAADQTMSSSPTSRSTRRRWVLVGGSLARRP